MQSFFFQKNPIMPIIAKELFRKKFFRDNHTLWICVPVVTWYFCLIVFQCFTGVRSEAPKFLQLFVEVLCTSLWDCIFPRGLLEEPGKGEGAHLDISP